MDFLPDDDLRSLSDLAGRLLADKATPDRLRAVELADGFDEDLWQALADAGLLGIGVAEEHGGSGLGAQGIAALLEQQGRRTALVPLQAVLCRAALPIARFGSASQRSRWLPAITGGTELVTGTFAAAPDGSLPLAGRRDGAAWSISGTLDLVSVAPRAAAFVVPFDVGSSTRVAVIDRGATGLSVSPLSVTSHENAGAVLLQDVRVPDEDLLPADGEIVVDRARTLDRIASAALAAGVCAEAVAMSAAYTSQRVQFGRPLSTNQAIALRAADGYLDTERIRLTAARAAWLADQGDDDAARSVSLVCAWWAATGGLRTVHATQHLHGGIGADVSYPIHRYFLWGRQIAFSLGAAELLTELGDAIDQVPPIGAPA